MRANVNLVLSSLGVISSRDFEFAKYRSDIHSKTERAKDAAMSAFFRPGFSSPTPMISTREVVVREGKEVGVINVEASFLATVQHLSLTGESLLAGKAVRTVLVIARSITVKSLDAADFLFQKVHELVQNKMAELAQTYPQHFQGSEDEVDAVKAGIKAQRSLISSEKDHFYRPVLWNLRVGFPFARITSIVGNVALSRLDLASERILENMGTKSWQRIEEAKDKFAKALK